MRGNWAEVSRLAKSHASLCVEPVDAQGNSARPEPVEGRNMAGGRPMGHDAYEEKQIQAIRAVPVHPSTGSGRTEVEVEK